VFTGLQARRDYIEPNSAVVGRVVRAITEAGRLLADRPGDAAQVLKKGAFAQFSLQDIEATLKNVGHTFRPSEDTAEDWRYTQELFRQAGAVPAITSAKIVEGQTWTSRFAREALR
jgi:ABC-type nitrate/sulfonate/bicarbonate transport system substrate-binding protein